MAEIIDFIKYKEAQEEANRLYVLRAKMKQEHPLFHLYKGCKGRVNEEPHKKGLAQLIADQKNINCKDYFYYIEPIQTKDAKYFSQNLV